MHRPAPVDVDMGLGRALARRAGARGRRRAPPRRARGRRPRRRARLASRAAASSSPSGSSRRTRRRPREKGLDDLDDALGPTPTGARATWKRVAAIAAGPAANILLALVLFTGLFMTSAGKATTTVEAVSSGSPAAMAGLQAGDKIVSIDGAVVQPEDISP